MITCKSFKVFIAASALCLAQLWLTPAFAGQWVSGYVSAVADYTAYAPTRGLMIKLTNMTWGVSDDALADGSTICTEAFRAAVGNQGVDENIKNRLYSMLLTALSSRQKVWLFVNKTNGNTPMCAVQIGSIGNTLP